MKTSGFIRPHSSKFSLLHRVLDVAIIWACLDTACAWYDVDFSMAYATAAACAVIGFTLGAEIGGFYQSWRMVAFREKAFRLLGIWAAVVLGLIVVSFLTKTSTEYSRVVVVGWMIAVPLLMLALEAGVHQFLNVLRKRGHNSRVVAFAGAGEVANKLRATIETSPWMGLNVKGVYDDRSAERLTLGESALQGKFCQLVADARAGKVDYVYITLPMRAENRIMQLVNQLADTTVSVYVVPDLFVFDLLHSRWFNMNGVPLVSVFETPFYGADGWLKRAEDLILGTLILLLIFPLMLAIALAVKLTSPGPAIFRQRRYGLNGEIIEVWKFRSMTVCEDGAHVPQARKGDSRVTRLGAFLRSTSLDELPQFINVLQGSMSIVGPRPHAVAHNEQYRGLIHGYMLRHKVKPGITGWAQINGWRGETDTLDKMKSRIECDLAYIRNWSIWLDLKIVVLTIFKGFAGKNAF